MNFHWKTEKPNDESDDDDVTSVATCEKLFSLPVYMCVCGCQQDMSTASTAC